LCRRVGTFGRLLAFTDCDGDRTRRCAKLTHVCKLANASPVTAISGKFLRRSWSIFKLLR
jgi:hypothetical protein